MKIQPGTEIQIYGLSYDHESGELEVYSCHHGWWGIPMDYAQALALAEESARTGSFLWKEVRHITV